MRVFVLTLISHRFGTMKTSLSSNEHTSMKIRKFSSRKSLVRLPRMSIQSLSRLRNAQIAYLGDGEPKFLTNQIKKKNRSNSLPNFIKKRQIQPTKHERSNIQRAPINKSGQSNRIVPENIAGNPRRHSAIREQIKK